MKYFVGLDLGTQSIKGLLFDPSGKQIASATQSYIPDFPRPNWCEQDVHVWVEAMRDVIRQLVAESGVPAGEIGSIGFASQCGGVVPIGADGNPLYKSILWLDRRAETQCDRIKNEITEDEAFKLVGAPIASSLVALKITWLKENEPEVFDKAMAFLQPGEYMVYWLTGQLVTDHAHASIYGLYDVSKREWSPRMAELTGVPIEKLCPVKAAADVAGTLTKQAAEYLGLDPSTIVVVGSGDQHVASLGSGLIRPGDILNIMGTAEIIAGVSDHVAYDEVHLLRTHMHVDPALWQIEQGALISGAAVRWYRDNVARISYNEMNAEAEKAPPGSNGLVFFSGLSGATSPIPHGYARGIFFGLTMSHTLPYITRSIYEGCAYGFRDSIESLEKMNMASGEIIASGGGINSAVWMQIKADMVGKTIRTLKNSDSTPLGAAILAGVAQGNFADFKQATSQLIEYGTTYEPNPANKQVYDDMYGFYREIFFNSTSLFDKYRTL